MLESSAGPEPRDWRFPYIDYVLYGILPEDTKEAAAIRRKAPKFYYNAITRTLYRRSHDDILLRCLSPKEAQEVLKEAHDGMCGAHQPGLKLAHRLQRLGYYWSKMIADAVTYAKRCHACQVHGDFIHQAPGYLIAKINKTTNEFKNVPCSLWLTGRVHKEGCDGSFSVVRLKQEIVFVF